jgi:hypothetical protein
MADPKGMKSALDGVGINTGNVNIMEMEDLLEKDRDELERELQCKLKEVMAERRKKLTCFQKTRSGVIKRGNIVKASFPVNSRLMLEELMHMIDVSVNSKYGVDLEGITRTIMDNVQGSLEPLRLEFRQESTEG